MSPPRSGAAGQALPADLTRDIERAGYYPALVRDVVGTALASDRVGSHLVHQETTFDHDTVRRHVTVLVLTDTRLLVIHADDDAESGLCRGRHGNIRERSARGCARSHAHARGRRPSVLPPGSARP